MERWTDTSVCYRHPEWPRSRPKARRCCARWMSAGIGEAWVFGYDAVATHAFEQANDERAPRWPRNTRTVSCRSASSIPSTPFPPSTSCSTSGFKSIKILTGWGNWLTIGNVRRVVVPIARTLQQRSLHLSIALEGNVPVTGGSTFLPRHRARGVSRGLHRPRPLLAAVVVGRLSRAGAGRPRPVVHAALACRRRCSRASSASSGLIASCSGAGCPRPIPTSSTSRCGALPGSATSSPTCCATTRRVCCRACSRCGQ